MPRFAFLLRLPVVLLLAHLYVVIRLMSPLSTTSGQMLILGLLCAVYACIMTGFLLRRSAGQAAADIVSWVGFLSLGLFSWLFVLTILRDIALIFNWILRAMPGAASFSASAAQIEHSVWLLLFSSIVLSLIGLINARRAPAIIKKDITIAGLPAALDGLTIAQITDLHVGPTIKKGFVNRVVKATNELQADVIVLTGDLIDGSVHQLRPHTQALAGLRARHGVYGVTGNHEYYAGADAWVEEFTRLGIKMLMNQHAILEIGGESLVLAGVTDFGAGHFDAAQASDPGAALHGCPDRQTVKILLAHQPRSMYAAEPAGFHLQLSGHTHGGQFWPWGYFVPLQQPFVAGLQRYKNLQIYISRGTGYWGPPMRLGSRSEISRLRLRTTSRNTVI